MTDAEREEYEEAFMNGLKALLRLFVKHGLDAETLCTLTESVIEGDNW